VKRPRQGATRIDLTLLVPCKAAYNREKLVRLDAHAAVLLACYSLLAGCSLE